MKQKLWIEELLKGDIARGAAANGMIGYFEGETNSAGNVEWTIPMLGGGYFTTEDHDAAQMISQNETIIALLLRQQKKVSKKQK